MNKARRRSRSPGTIRSQVYEPDKQLFMDKVQPVYDEFAEGAVGELVNRIRTGRHRPCAR
jgi:hypothetical protein